MNYENRLKELELRLHKTESELEIRNLITRYSLAADCGDATAAANCHTEDAIYTVSAPCAGRSEKEGKALGNNDLYLRGREEIADMLCSPLHQTLLPDCAHTVGPFLVEVEHNKASAIGYSRLYRKHDEEIDLMRLSINKWLFEKHENRWFIAARESRPIGTDEAQAILKQQ